MHKIVSFENICTKMYHLIMYAHIDTHMCKAHIQVYLYTCHRNICLSVVSSETCLIHTGRVYLQIFFVTDDETNAEDGYFGMCAYTDIYLCFMVTTTH
jgi:hypothetical protein